MGDFGIYEIRSESLCSSFFPTIFEDKVCFNVFTANFDILYNIKMDGLTIFIFIGI